MYTYYNNQCLVVLASAVSQSRLGPDGYVPVFIRT